MISHILVPVDYSDCSKAALKWAAAIAERFGAALDVVHVWDRPPYVSDTVTVRQGDQRRSLIEMIRENAERDMEEFLRAAELPAAIPFTQRLLSGEPVSTLLRLLGDGKHDLVVVGTHGRTGLTHVLLGSVAEKLVRLSPVPVSTVPDPARARHLVDGADLPARTGT